jgi:5-methylcytosine-specific restriction endonuclease McrA
VRGGVCSVCGPRAGTGWQHTATRQARGYDAAWYRLRARVIEQRRLAGGGIVLCEECGLPIVGGQIHGDHLVPFHGLDDPLRLDARNVRLAHKQCHMRKTAKQAR